VLVTTEPGSSGRAAKEPFDALSPFIGPKADLVDIVAARSEVRHGPSRFDDGLLHQISVTYHP
jgi:hypothetical protein